MKVLFLCPRLPYPPDRGDRIRSFNTIRSLLSKHEVTVICFQEKGESDDYIQKLEKIGADVHTIPLKISNVVKDGLGGVISGLPIHVAYYKSNLLKKEIEKILQGNKYDLVYASLMRMAQYCYNLELPVILDFTDSLALNYSQRAKIAKGMKRWYLKYDSITTGRYERFLTKVFNNIVVCSDIDREFIIQSNPKCNPVVIPNAVDTEYFSPQNKSMTQLNDTFIFMGTMDYLPNVDAAEIFAKEILPKIRLKRPQAQFVIVGRNPSSAVNALSKLDGVTVTGGVPDVRPYLANASVFVAPMRIGTGTQNKVLEAMAAGVPVIASELVGKSLGIGEKDGLFATDNYEKFADVAIELCSDENYHRYIANLSRHSIMNKYSFKGISDSLAGLAEKVAYSKRYI